MIRVYEINKIVAHVWSYLNRIIMIIALENDWEFIYGKMEKPQINDVYDLILINKTVFISDTDA